MSEKKKKSKKKTEVPPRPAGHADTSNCRGCKYHDPNPMAVGSCNYCYMTGHVRGSSVEECKKKEVGERLIVAVDQILVGERGPVDEKKKMMHIEKPWEQPVGRWSGFCRADAWELYKSGHSDAAIAEKLGVTRQTIRAWRNKHALPPHPNKGGPRSDGAE